MSKNVEERRHCCGMTLQNEGIGYKDLDELLSKPSDLEFIIELFSIEQPEDYEKERWQMNDEEKMNAQEALREKGNNFYKERNYKEAEECYRKAVGMIEQLMTKCVTANLLQFMYICGISIISYFVIVEKNHTMWSGWL